MHPNPPRCLDMANACLSLVPRATPLEQLREHLRQACLNHACWSERARPSRCLRKSAVQNSTPITRSQSPVLAVVSDRAALGTLPGGDGSDAVYTFKNRSKTPAEPTFNVFVGIRMHNRKLKDPRRLHPKAHLSTQRVTFREA